jgi:hypothetical protein
MQFKIFTVPVSDDGTIMEEMNKFLRSYKVLSVEQQLVSGKVESHWHFCIKYLANTQVENKTLPTGIDYYVFKPVKE